MLQPGLFDAAPVQLDDPCRNNDDYAADRGACRYPDLKTLSAYRYGCRCVGCRKSNSAQSHRNKGSWHICKTPGCDKPKRRVSGAQYCDDHATGINYKAIGAGYAHIICAVCQEPARVQRSKAYPFCRRCQASNVGLFRAALAHHVPLTRVLQWIADPRCDLCARSLYIGKGKSGACGFAIDHDHAHCNSDKGCAACVRGLLCHRCNTRLGSYESLLEQSGVERLTEYLTSVKVT